MDIKQCRYFIALAEEQQITAAARRLHMAQPPLSQQLKQMELELGTALFERSGRRLQLTEAGKAFYSYAVAITKSMEEALSEVKEIGEGVRGKLAIGVNTISDVQLPERLKQFRAAYPQVTYKIQQNESNQLCQLLLERVIELAFVRLPLQSGEFDVLPLTEEPFYFAVSPEFRLDAAQVTYKQIQPFPLLLPSIEGMGLYDLIMNEFTNRRLIPNLIGECSDISVLLELVEAGFGTTIVPETVLKVHKRHKLKVFPIADSRSPASSALIWLKNRHLSKPAQRFVELFSAGR